MAIISKWSLYLMHLAVFFFNLEEFTRLVWEVILSKYSLIQVQKEGNVMFTSSGSLLSFPKNLIVGKPLIPNL